MPAIIGAIEFVLWALGASAGAAAFLAPIIVSIGASLVLGEINKLFVKGTSVSSLNSQIASRVVISRRG